MAGERILVVEDNATSAKLVAYLLRASGYEVVLACDADAALEVIHQRPPDLVLVDIQLPRVDGLQLVRRVREDVASRHLPVIAVTAYAMKGDKEKAIAVGCDDYITKPIDTRTLPAAIADLLKRRSSASVREP